MPERKKKPGYFHQNRIRFRNVLIIIGLLILSVGAIPFFMQIFNTENPKYWQSFALTSFLSLLWIYLLTRYDKLKREPLSQLLWVGLAGGLISGEIAGILNTIVTQEWLSLDQLKGYRHPFRFLVGYLFVGFNEEGCKLLATLAVLRFSRITVKTPLDVLLFAMATGVGFTLVESIQYASEQGLQVVVSRQFTPMHLLFDAVWGYGLASARFVEQRRAYASTLLLYWVLAALLHGAWDFFITLEAAIVWLNFGMFQFLMVYFFGVKLPFLMEQTQLLSPGECPHCRALNEPNAQWCAKCGIRMDQTFFKHCRACDIRVFRNARFCPRCGNPL
ncbi:MAG: PrsW family intramembrane metalloprotease [SAR324 cluster bacterium]|nr:PrsW family intramembrane metalloprotease [SAR324 cluster bacterium]